MFRRGSGGCGTHCQAKKAFGFMATISGGGLSRYRDTCIVYIYTYINPKP